MSPPEINAVRRGKSGDHRRFSREGIVNVGDKVRLMPRPAHDELGLPEGQIGTVVDIDASHKPAAVLISFPDVDVYTSAVGDSDVEVVAQDGDP